MVCLHGLTMKLLNESLTQEEMEDYPAWSWLIYRLTEYIHQLDPRSAGVHPTIPLSNDNTHYARWFSQVQIKLGETFNDATETRTFKCLENCPAEEVALLIYDATEATLLNGFLQHLKQTPNPSTAPPVITIIIEDMLPLSYNTSC